VVDLLAIRKNGFGENWREFERSWEKFWNRYVCVSASVYVQHASAVNCQGLTAAGFIFPRHLTAEGSYFTCVSQPNQCQPQISKFWDAHFIYR